MEFLVSQLPLCLVLCAGVFVQSAAGFAAGLMIVPSLLLLGHGLPEAQCALLVATIPQNAWGIWRLRESISLRDIGGPGAGRVCFLPLGVIVLKLLVSLDPTMIRQVVGGIVLIVTLAIIWIQPQPKPKVHPVWTWITFPLSGFFQGLVGMGGPPMVFWVQAHDWGTKRTRAFLFAMYGVSILPALGLLFWAFGDRIIQPGLVAAAATPVLLLIANYGIKFGTWLGRDRLRALSLTLLMIIGITSLLAPWITPS